MSPIVTLTPSALRDQAAKSHLDNNTAGYLRAAANTLESTQRDLKRARRAADLRTTPESKRTISALQADRTHLQDSAERLRSEREAHAAELARCVRRLRASGKCPPAVLEDLQALDASMTASINHHPRKAHR